MRKTTFCQKNEVFSSNFQFTCAEKFSAFGCILYFSQKVVGVTLILKLISFAGFWLSARRGGIGCPPLKTLASPLKHYCPPPLKLLKNKRKNNRNNAFIELKAITYCFCPQTFSSGNPGFGVMLSIY